MRKYRPSLAEENIQTKETMLRTGNKSSMLGIMKEKADLDDWPTEKLREKSRERHNHKPQPFPDPKRKRKPTNLNKHKPNQHTKSTKISYLFPE